MSYRYYGGTFESSPERVLADMEWKKKRYSHEDWKREAEATKRFTWLINGLIPLLGLSVWSAGALLLVGRGKKVYRFSVIYFFYGKGTARR